MKKTLFALLVIGLVSSSSFSQNISYGATGGVNIGNVTGNYFDEFDARIGLNLQGFAEFMLTRKFSIQPGVGFVMQGGVGREIDEQGDRYKADMALNYVNVPVMAKYYLIKGLAIEVGPQFGFLVDGKINTRYDTESDTVETSEFDARDYLETMDVSLNLGASYVFAKRMFLMARYNMGLSDIDESIGQLVDDFEEGVNNNFDFKNTGFTVALGYRF